jgi:hypothetical protein
MTLTVETGSGVSGADTYAALATINTYWTNRPHVALATTWGAAGDPNKEGAAREATAFLDAVWGRYYRGVVQGRAQGLLWPRSDAFDDADYLITGLPKEIVTAVCELSARALSAPLVADTDNSGAIKRKREKIDVIEEETEYATSAGTFARYGFVGELLNPVLNGSQPGAVGGWHFR